MHAINFPFLSRFISAQRFRTGQELVGPINGMNVDYVVPSGEKFIQDKPYIQIVVYWNGIRLMLEDDYTVSESGGSGTGYDTVSMLVPPMPGDHLIADYITV